MPAENRRTTALLSLAIVAAAFLAYWPALGGGFVFDDHTLIEGSPLLKGPLWRLWFTTEPLDFWPLTYTTFWLETRLWGEAPFAYHLVNVGLHGATAALLWRVLRRLEVPGAWLAGLLFAVHPVTVESVAWISERKNVFSGVLFLSSLLWWLRYREDGGTRRYGTSLALFLLALLAKTSTVMLPVVLLGVSLWRNRRLARRDWLEAAPFFGLSLLLGLVTVWFQTARAMSGGVAVAGWPEKIGRSAWAWVTYLRQAVAPVDLAFVYPPWPETNGVLFWLPLIGSAAAVAALLGLRRREPFRAFLFAAGYHALLLLPVLGLLEIAYFQYGPISNHLQYLALMGPVALVAAGLSSLSARWGRSGMVAGALLAVCCALSTAHRASAFRDDLSLWKAAVREAPQSFNAAWTLALRLGEAGRGQEAGRTLVEARSRLTDPASRLRVSALLSLIGGRPEAAVAEANRAQRLRYDAYFPLELGIVLTSEGYPEWAVPLLRSELSRQPKNGELRYRLGSALAKAGRVEEAIGVMREACRLSPTRGANCAAFVVLLARSGRLNDARAELATVLGVPPSAPEVERVLRESGIGPPSLDSSRPNLGQGAVTP